MCIFYYLPHDGYSENQLDESGDDHELDFMLALKKFRMSHPKNCIAGHLNINNIRNKFMEISELMSNNFLDIMCLSETKIDGSFPIAQFSLPGFKCHRADRNEHGGGIMAYVRNDLPHRRRSDLEHSTHLPVESLIFEIIIRKEKWLFICLYSPHNKYKKQCCDSIETFLTRCRLSTSPRLL